MISTSSFPCLSGAVLVLLLTSTAFAGQLFLERYGLKQVSDGGEALLVGTVESVTPPTDRAKSHDSRIVLKVERVIGKSGVKAGASETLEVYGGVVWDNPHKSPMDRRLEGAVEPVKGARVIAVPARGPEHVELLPANEQTLRTATILWDPDAKKTWLASTDDALAKEMADRDLVALAVAELERRKTLTAARLLAADEDFLARHVREMSPAKRTKLFAEGTPLAAKDTEIRDRLFALVTREPEAGSIGALAPLIALYDPAKDPQQYGDAHLALISVEGKADYSTFVDFVVAYEKHRPSHQSSDDDLPEITARMSAKAKAAVAKRFVEIAHDTTFSEGEYDLFLLSEAARLAKEAPNASLVPALATIDPTKPRVTSTQEAVLDTLLEIGTVIVAALPAEKPRVQQVLQRWIDEGAPATEKVRKAYLKTVGEPKKEKAKKESLELRAGDTRRLGTGVRVGFAKREDGWFDVSFGQGQQSTEWGIDPALDWYREYWVEPYLVTIDRVGTSDAIKLALSPHAIQPAEIDEPKNYATAKALATKAGCPDYGSHETRSWEGHFEYRSTGPGGKSCTIVIGTFTGTTRVVTKP